MSSRQAVPTVADALAHLRRGDTVLGAAMLDTVLRHNPRDPAALGLAGTVALQRGDMTRAIDLLSRGKVTSKGIVTHKYPLDRWDEALEVSARPESVKVLLQPNSGA